MARGRQGTDLPSTGNGLETGTSLLQITAVYLSLLVICPFNDPLKNDIIRETLKANIKHQRKTIMGFMCYCFRAFDPSFYSHLNLSRCFCALRVGVSASSLTFGGSLPLDELFVCFAAFRHPAGTDKDHTVQQKSKTASKLENEPPETKIL